MASNLLAFLKRQTNAEDGNVIEIDSPLIQNQDYTRKDTRAYDLYAKYYNNYIRTKTPLASRTVNRLTLAVNYAELAIVIWQKNKDKFELGHHQDNSAKLQLGIFRAATWLRRFIYERVQVNSWYDQEERKEAAKLTEDLESDAKVMLDELVKVLPHVSEIIKLNRNKWNSLNDRQVILVKNDASQSQSGLVKSDSEPQESPRLENHQEESNEKEKDKGPKTSLAVAAQNHAADNLDQALGAITRLIELSRFYVRELEDCPGEKNDKMKRDIQTAIDLAKSMNKTLVVPEWRNQGIVSLGPFGINHVKEDFVGINFKELFEKAGVADITALVKAKKIGEYTVKDEFSKGQHVTGETSPFFLITIPRKDETYQLIRIPENAHYFCWAYPVDSEFTVDEYSHEDMNDFLTLGGYLYFDKKLNLIRSNALKKKGFQLQFSSPHELKETMLNVLEEENRFHEITIDALKDKGATHFAWVLPGEFSKMNYPGLSEFHPGAFAYKYDTPKKNNYFVLAAVDSVVGKKKVQTDASFE